MPIVPKIEIIADVLANVIDDFGDNDALIILEENGIPNRECHVLISAWNALDAKTRFRLACGLECIKLDTWIEAHYHDTPNILPEKFKQ